MFLLVIDVIEGEVCCIQTKIKELDNLLDEKFGTIIARNAFYMFFLNPREASFVGMLVKRA